MSLKAKIMPFLFPPMAGICVGMAVGRLLEGKILLGGLMLVFSTGLFCNWLVLRSNGWKMPVKKGCRIVPGDCIHVEMASHHRLTVLADIISVGPIWASIGDLLIVTTLGPITGLQLLEIL